MLPAMKPFKLELGLEVEDTVSGFRGSIVTRSQYLTGCNRYGVQARVVKKNEKPLDWMFFDEDQLKIIGKGVSFKRELPAGPVQREAVKYGY